MAAAPGGGGAGGGGMGASSLPHTSQQLITSLPTAVPSTRHARHGAGRETEAQSHKWLVHFAEPGDGGHQEGLAGDQIAARGAGATLPATRPSRMPGQPGTAALGGKAGL